MEFLCYLGVLLFRINWVKRMYASAINTNAWDQRVLLCLNHTFLFLGIGILLWYYSWCDIALVVLVIRSLTITLFWFMWDSSINKFF